MKKVLTYLLLVGFPLLGVVGVLRIGESMMPTLCIHGPWKMEVSKPATSSSCEGQLRRAEPLAFSISQSGPQFSLSFNNEKKGVLHGEIRNTDLQATGRHFSRGSVLQNENSLDAIGLRATLDRQAKPARLWGVLSFSKCPELAFVATQQTGAGSTTEVR